MACEFDRDQKRECYVCGLGVLRTLRPECPYKMLRAKVEELEKEVRLGRMAEGFKRKYRKQVKRYEKALDVKNLTTMIGVGIHTGLRKWCESEESGIAWNAINDMDEWSYVCSEVAKSIAAQALLDEEK